MDYDLLNINNDIDHKVMKQVLQLANEPNRYERLVIVLDTYGGSPHYAYRSMSQIQNLYKRIDIVVPNKAMSAGTLMCLGGDKIHMWEGSCLGPLDLQIEHPGDGSTISSLDVQQSSYLIFGLTNTLTKQFYEQARDELQLSKTSAASLAYNSAVKLMSPLIDKMDPFHLEKSYRSATIGQKYSRILLMRRMMSRNPDQAIETSKKLANDYSMHNYSITLEEAKVYLELTVGNITELDVHQDVLSRYNSNREGVHYEKVRTPGPQANSKNKNGRQENA